MTYEESVMYSQLICTKERKVFFAGIAESSRPGAIHMIKYNEQKEFDKLIEIQAHSTAVERLALTHDDKFLFSAGNDGSIGCFKFANKEQKDHSHGLTTLSLFDDIMI
jgi:hypothetical protein